MVVSAAVVVCGVDADNENDPRAGRAAGVGESAGEGAADPPANELRWRASGSGGGGDEEAHDSMLLLRMSAPGVRGDAGAVGVAVVVGVAAAGEGDIGPPPVCCWAGCSPAGRDSEARLGLPRSMDMRPPTTTGGVPTEMGVGDGEGDDECASDSLIAMGGWERETARAVQWQ